MPRQGQRAHGLREREQRLGLGRGAPRLLPGVLDAPPDREHVPLQQDAGQRRAQRLHGLDLFARVDEREQLSKLAAALLVDQEHRRDAHVASEQSAIQLRDFLVRAIPKVPATGEELRVTEILSRALRGHARTDLGRQDLGEKQQRMQPVERVLDLACVQGTRSRVEGQAFVHVADGVYALRAKDRRECDERESEQGAERHAPRSSTPASFVLFPAAAAARQ